MENSKNIEPSRTSQDLHPSDCFACGLENEKSLKVSILFDEKTGETKFIHKFCGHETGALGKIRLVHGGAIAAILDEAQGVLAHHIGHLVMTDTLNLKYHKGTPIGEPVEIHAWITAVRKRRLYTKATLKSLSGELLVSSSGRWYILPDRMRERIDKEINGIVRGYHNDLMDANRQRAKKIRKSLKQKNS
ncbi:MAG: PaaI family thioesterase [Leptospiraceae bacterium]|nr:PaaI family thioesterase [Leptospiraceae bacterium]MCP5511570.1 PaaI family thioesterase [Leptospiraceae bacterium]